MIFELQIKEYKTRVINDIYEYTVSVLIFSVFIGALIYSDYGLIISLVWGLGIFLLFECWAILASISQNKKIIEKIEIIDNRVLITFNCKEVLSVTEFSIDEINMEYYQYIGKGVIYSLKIKKGYALFYEQESFGGWEKGDLKKIAEEYNKYKKERKSKI